MEIISNWIKIGLLLALLSLLAACGPAQLPPSETSAPLETSSPQPHTAVGETQSPPPLTPTPETETPTSEPAIPTAEPETPSPQPHPLKVAFVKDKNAWIWVEGKGSSPLTESGGVLQVLVSDDGELVAYTREVDEFHQEIWVTGTTEPAGSERRLVSVDQFEQMQVKDPSPFRKGTLPANLKFIPGSHRLVFNIYQAFEGPGMGIFDDLRSIDADNGEIELLLGAGFGGVPFFSPDGSQMAIVTMDQISLANADSSNYRAGVLIFEPVMTYSEYYFIPRPAWASDSSFFRVAIPPRDPLAQPPQATSLWRVPMDGDKAVQEGSVIAISLWDFGPHYSPDLSKIVYTKEVGSPEQNMRELHIADADGSNDLVYHTAPMLIAHGWAGSSDLFVFSQGPDQEYKLGTPNGDMRSLTEDPFNIIRLEWLDGNRFIYLKSVGGDITELRLNALDGENLMAERISGFPNSYDVTR
jgi:predicted small lipoprotein YifL